MNRFVFLRRFTATLLTFCLLLGLSACGKEEGGDTPSSTNEFAVYHSDKDYIAVLDIKDYGTITLRLLTDVAPTTVNNFVTLAESGFYNGLTFHRIMSGFMMQGGDPDGDGTGNTGSFIKGEFAVNGYNNPLPHKRGVLSMARGGYSYDSASCQFFIMHVDYPSLDGQYAAFGYVTDGMDVVDAVCKAAKPTDDNGTIPAEKQPVITSLTVQPVNE